MNKDYILIKKLYSNKDIQKIKNSLLNKKEYQSKVGDSVKKINKIRKDVFLSVSESKNVDEIFFL